MKYNVGDWFIYTEAEYCILSKYDTQILLMRRDSLVSLSRWVNVSYFESKGPVYLGTSKKKWYWRFIPWRDLVHPFPYIELF